MIKRSCFFLHILLLSLCFPNTFSAAENTTPSGIPIEELEEFVDDYAEEYIGNTVAGAVIIVIKDNQIVLSKGYGFSDIENQIPMDPEITVLEWGSIAKLFVWVSAMQLAEQGELDLEEDIRSYLPEDFLTKLNFDEQPITMLNLMHHNAGFEEYIFDLLFDSPEHLVSLEESLKLAEPKQVYKPGKVVAYSNYSTSLAAYIIEGITGQPFYEYVDEHIRMLANPMRAYSELFLHFIGTYCFTITSLISLVMVIIYWKKAPLSKWQKGGYLLTCISSILFIAWLFIWQMYS